MRMMDWLSTAAAKSIFVATTLVSVAGPARADSKSELAQVAFSKSVDADLALGDADTALAAGKIQQARDFYRYASELSPDDPTVSEQWARFELAQGHTAVALKLLETAYHQDPHNLEVAYERAYCYVLLDRSKDAEDAFFAYRHENPGDKRPAYYLGLYALARQDLPAAQAFFDEGRQGDDRLAALSFGYFAVIAAQRGDTKAPGYAEQALKVAPDEQWKLKLQPIAALSSKRILPWVSVRGIVMGEYDSNPALGLLSLTGSGSVTPTMVKSPAGYRVTEEATLTIRPLALKPITIELEGDFVNANHLNDRAQLKQFDFGGPTATARFISRVGRDDGVQGEFELDGVFRDIWTNTYATHYETSIGAYPSVGLIFAPRHYLFAVGMLEHRNFIDDNEPHTPYDRNSFSTSVGLSYQVPFWIFDFSIGAGYDQDNTVGTEYFFRGGHANGQLRAHLYKDFVLLSGFADADARWYNEAQPQRLEIRSEYGGILRWNINKYVSLQGTYSFTRNAATAFIVDPTTGLTVHSIYPQFSYVRNLVGLSVIAYF